MRKKGQVTRELCQDCGKVFLGGANAFFCPKCRKLRLSEAAKSAG